ncbi:MAG: hypothetical protein AB7D36_05535 [Oscillospiraceae bacterium]
MKFTVNTKDFSEAMNKAFKGVAKKAYAAILENVQIVVHDNVCRVNSANLEQYVSTKIDAYGSDDMAFIFRDTKAVLKALKFFTGDVIIFDQVGKNAVKMTCGTKKAELLISEADLFPDFPEVTGEQFVYSADKLISRYNAVKYAVSNNDSRPVMMGIHFNNADIVTCDGWRLAMNTDDALTVNKPFTVMDNALKLCSDVLSGNITITANGKHVKFEDSNAVIISRLFDGEYFDYRKVIPANVNSVTVNIKDFSDNLKYLKTFARDLPAAWNGNKLALVTVDGRFDCEINLAGSFNFTIGFNMAYMLEALSQFKESKSLNILMPDRNVGPITMQNGSDFAMILPVRLKDGDPFQTAEDVA